MEKLSEDVWIDIFDLLSSEDIENAANSCENWRNIITSTPSLMRKLTLHINFANFKGKTWNKWPYKTLHLERVYGSNKNKIKEFIDDIDFAGVEKIIIIKSNYNVIKILNNFQNITTLIAHKLTGCNAQGDKKIDLPNLTHLKIDDSAFCLLPKIRSHKIEVFCAYEDSRNPYRGKYFGSFLQTCDKLKHLTLKDFYTDEIMKIKSQLDTFEIIDVNKTLPSSFVQFLKYQKSSLKNLSLVVEEFDDEIANFIYFQMNLDKLVDFRIYYRSQIKNLKKVSVKNLTIYSEDDNFEYFEKLFRCCEMLEVLSVDLRCKKPLDFLRMLPKLPKLKFLDLRVLFSTEEFQPTFKFNRLERLILFENFKTDQCVKIIRCCPNLTHIRTFNIFAKNDFENIFEVCNKIQEIFLFSSNQEFTNEDIETYKDVGSKINLKIETNNKELIEKLSDAKNRLTVIPAKLPSHDPFVFP